MLKKHLEEYEKRAGFRRRKYFTRMDFKTAYINAMLSIGKNIGAGLATIGLTGAGIGVGLIFASYIFSLSRNSGYEEKGFKYVMLGFALTEAVGLLALMVAFLILFT